MEKVKVIVGIRQKVATGRLACALSFNEHLEVVGRGGADLLQEASLHQPDFIIFELHAAKNYDLDMLKKLKGICRWTRIIVINLSPKANTASPEKLMEICDGYLEGPFLTGFLLKAVEMACSSGMVYLSGQSRKMILHSDEVVSAFE